MFLFNLADMNTGALSNLFPEGVVGQLRYVRLRAPQKEPLEKMLSPPETA